MPDELWSQLVNDLRNRADMKRAVKAAKAISRVATEAHVPMLYDLLQDASFWVREVAAEPLARLDGIKALPALFQAITQGELDGHDNDGLSFCIIELVEADKATAAPVLLEMLSSSTDAERRSQALWALGFVASEIPADALLAALSDPDQRIRAEAAGSLASFKDDPRVVDALLNCLNDGDQYVRDCVVSALGYVGDKRALEPLKALRKDTPESSSRFVEYALKQLGDA